MKLGSPVRRKLSRIEIIPLIDIMFFLLASFMMVSLQMDQTQNLKVNLPTAVAAGKILFPATAVNSELIEQSVSNIETEGDLPIISANVFTFGGLKIDTQARVLDGDGQIVAVRDEDGEATLKKIYRDNAPFAWRTLRRLGVVPEDIEDVCQEVFLVVHTRLGPALHLLRHRVAARDHDAAALAPVRYRRCFPFDAH
jgi:hypothetical protein